MLTFGAIQQAQQGLSRDQLAQAAQAATIKPPAPPPSVLTSAPAQKATTQNLNTLTQAESVFSQPPTDNPLEAVYQKRPDLQQLYNPDGNAKNPADPRVAGIPTLSDWAGKYGMNEEQTLKLSPITSNNPALNSMTQSINDVLKRAGVNLTPEQQSLLSEANFASDAELKALAGARTASDSKQYKTLNDYMKQVEDIRQQRTGMITQLFDQMKMTEQEKLLAGQVNDITNQEQNLDLRTEAGLNETAQQQIPLRFIQGEQQQLLRQANLQLKTLAAQKAPLIQQLELAFTTRQQNMDAMKTAIEMAGDDINLMLSLGEVAQELEQTIKTEQKAAKEFALTYSISQPFYNIGGTIYRSSDGKAYSTPDQFFADGGAQDWSNVETVDSGSQTERAIVEDFITKYPDAGIGLTDTLEAAQQKLSGSRIYQDEVRPPSSGGGTVTERKSAAKQVAIQKARPEMQAGVGKDGYVNPGVYLYLRSQYASEVGETATFDSTYSPMLSPQERARLGIGKAVGIKAEQSQSSPFLSTDWFKRTYKLNDKEAQEYMAVVEGYRQAGLSDEDILNEISE